uniref:Uncharacterized protein n=1 Tax=Arundo donax TaxID=35708 RepID=A0A0A9GA27_ARUDO
MMMLMRCGLLQKSPGSSICS